MSTRGRFTRGGIEIQMPLPQGPGFPKADPSLAPTILSLGGLMARWVIWGLCERGLSFLFKVGRLWVRKDIILLAAAFVSEGVPRWAN